MPVADVIAFDVNDTLLDLSALDPSFEQVFGSAAVRPQWFAQVLQLAFVGTITGHYVDFTTAQQAAAIRPWGPPGPSAGPGGRPAAASTAARGP